MARIEGFRLAKPDSEQSASDAELVVVLMGWVDSKHQHVAKYSRLLTSQNSICLQTIQNISASFSFRDPPNCQHAERILDFIDRTGLCTNRKLVLYAFSNGGATVYEQIGIIFSQGRFKELHDAIVGVVFDSYPAYMQLNKGLKAMTIGLPAVLGLLVKIFFTLYANFYVYFIGSRPAKFWKRMHTDLGVPELYMYGEDDDLTSFSELDNLVDCKMARKPGAVTKKVWEQARHLAHLVDHPEDYALTVRSFLSSVTP